MGFAGSSHEVILRSGRILALCAGLTGCAAMQRTWFFEATPIASHQLSGRATLVSVTRDNVYIELALKNPSRQPRRVDLETLTLLLPDGGTLEGDVSLLEQGAAMAGAALEYVGWMEESDERLAPGGVATMTIVFRDRRRDLRRYPWMTVDFGSVMVDGQPAMLPAMILKAPPEAPMGQDI